VLTQLPAASFAALATSNPTAWIAFGKQAALGLMIDPDSKESIEADFKRIQPITQILSSCSGAFALGACWAKEKGFGLTVVGETPSANNAATQASLLTNFLKTGLNQPISEQNGVASLPAVTPANEMLPLQISWRAKDAWLQFASSPAWLNSAKRAEMIPPPQVLGADCAFWANMGFLTSLLNELEANYGHKETLDYFRQLKLDQIRLLGYSRIADDGTSLHMVMELHNANGMTASTFLGTAIIAAIVYPVFAKSRVKAQQTKSLSNLRQLALADMMYMQDNIEVLPPLKTPEDIKGQLEVPDSILYQPSSHMPYLPNVSIAGKSLGQFAEPESMILFYEQTPYEGGGRIAAFMDGHVAYLTQEEWEAAKVKSGIK
jgi:hypothetical protein